MSNAKAAVEFEFHFASDDGSTVGDFLDLLLPYLDRLGMDASATATSATGDFSVLVFLSEQPTTSVVSELMSDIQTALRLVDGTDSPHEVLGFRGAQLICA